jgi:hypothetical protein
MMHLALFALAVKLWAMKSEGDKWQVTVGIFFVFLAAMATSTHPSIVLYLVVFAGLALLLLTRYTYFHHVRLEAQRGRLLLGPRSVKRYVAGFSLLVLVLSVPLFLAFPRLQSPYLAAGSGGPGGSQLGTGFSDQVTLDVIGSIRASREVALRLRLDGEREPASDFRLKGATYDRYQAMSWIQSAIAGVVSPDRGRFRLADGETVETMRVWLQPLKARSLIVPVEAVSLDLDLPALQRDVGGALAMFHEPRTTLEYSVDLAPSAQLTGRPAAPDDPRDHSLDSSGISDAVRELAQEVAGEGARAEQAERIERHLIQDYEYTLDLLRRSSERPIDDFLFRYRSGHCEYFASAMVLMLRSIGIPARFVTGFLGAEYNPFEGYYIVRQSNAHAWVEAYLPDEGWRTFDPTPPAGRPSSAPPSLGLLLRQSWDWVEFRWDRYIISFTAYDQGRLVSALRERLRSLRQALVGAPSAPVASSTTGVGPEGVTASASSRLTRFELGLLAILAIVTLLLGAWATRPPLTASRAFLRLRRRAAMRGVDLDPSVPPRAACDRVVTRFPSARRPAERLLDLYLLESFGESLLDSEQRREVERALADALDGLEKRAS